MKKILSLLLAGVTAVSLAAAASAAIPEGLVVHEGVDGYANEGYENLFDYDETTKWCHGSSWSYVIWEMPNAVEITGYQMVTANDTEANPGRNPLSWILSGSNDYDAASGSGDWTEIVNVEGDATLEGKNYTPYTFTLDAKAPSYKFYQLEIVELVEGSTFQLSGFNLIFDGAAAQEVKSEEEIQAEAAAAAMATYIEQGYVPAVTLNKVEGITVVSATAGAAETEMGPAAFDYDTATKWCCNQGGPFEVIWEMPSAVAITGYQLATANDTEGNPGRNPKDWTLSGSTDGSSWTVIDEKVGDTTMLAANYLPFDFMLAETAPEYKFYKFECTATADDGATIQLSEINLIYDGAIAEAAAEEVVEETAPVEEVVEEAAPVEEVVEETVAEETAPVEEVVEETVVVETAPVEEVVETAPVEEAPQTFDAAVIAGVAAVVSLAGYAISKKR